MSSTRLSERSFATFALALLLLVSSRSEATAACPVGTTLPAGTACSTSDYTVGPAVKGTDAVSMCQQAGGCFANSPTVTYTQQPMSALAAYAGRLAGVFNPLSYGATCGSADSTAGVQAAVNAALAATGGTVVITCPMTVAGQVNIGTNGMQGGVRLTGSGPMSMPAVLVNPGGAAQTGSATLLWPPTVGAAIVCTGTGSSACIMVNGSGVEIDHINFGNIQPTPPSTGTTWNPTVFPWVIGTQGNTGWQGLHIHDVTFTSTSQAIDLEGTSNYAQYSGAAIRVENVWCDACLNTGIRIHLIDNSQIYSHIDFVPTGYYFSYPAVGNYLRQNSVGIDIQYAAAPQFHDLNFFTHKSAIQIQNGTVTNNFGNLNFGMSAGHFSNVMFNQVCQAVTLPGGNGTIAEIFMSNVHVWGDQSGFACSKGKAMFDLPSNDMRITMSEVGLESTDTFLNIGCGTPGTGSCPTGTPGGNAWATLNITDQGSYSAFSTGQPWIKAPSGAIINLGYTNQQLIIPAAGAGPIYGAGLDGTTGNQAPFNVGGGTNAVSGAVQMQPGPAPGMGPTTSGYSAFFSTDHSENGWVGGCNNVGAATTQGCSFSAPNGYIFLKPNYAGTSPKWMTVGSVSGALIVNVLGLVTSCTGQITGTLWNNAGVINICP